jgi:hypothetical protein
MAAGVVLARAGAPEWGVLVQWSLGLALLAAFFSRRYLRHHEGPVRLDDVELTVPGTRMATRARIRGAYLSSTEEPLVRVDCRLARALEVRFFSNEDARAFVAALGFGVNQSVVSFRVFHGGGARLWMTMLSVAVVWSIVGAFTARTLLRQEGASLTAGLTLPLLLVAILAIQVRSSGLLDVGADGLLLRRLAARRFISYSALDEVSAVDGFLGLALSSGERIRLHAGARAAAVASRIEEARNAFREGRDRVDPLIDPAGRTVDRWLSDLRSARPVAYRDAHLDADNLWRVLDSTGAPATRRAGAALALSPSLDDASRGRLRVAAEACAEPRLRVVLERVAGGASDAELEEALAPLIEAER